MKLLSSLAEKHKKLKAEFEAAGKSAVEDALKWYFDKHPEVAQIQWAQHAPHFNDGDPCIFQVYDVYALSKVNDRASMWGYDDDDGESGFLYWNSTIWDEKLKKSVKNDEPEPEWHKDLNILSDALHECEDLLEMTFGDAVVRATRDGIEFDYEEHD